MSPSDEHMGALPAKSASGGFVYFMRCHSPDRQIKIGHARDLVHRLGNLRNGCPYEITCMLFLFADDPKSVERALHARFQAHRIRLRSEWFRPDAEIEAFIADAQREQARAIVRLLNGGGE